MKTNKPTPSVHSFLPQFGSITVLQPGIKGNKKLRANAKKVINLA
jgi:hypothetical protein